MREFTVREETVALGLETPFGQITWIDTPFIMVSGIIWIGSLVPNETKEEFEQFGNRTRFLETIFKE